MSPYSAGLQQLLRACSDCGEQYDLKFNIKNSVVMLVLPSLYQAGQELSVVNKVKYLGHIIRSDLFTRMTFSKLYAQHKLTCLLVNLACVLMLK